MSALLTTVAIACNVIAILPTLMFLGRAGWRRLRDRRSADAAPSVEGQGAEASPSLYISDGGSSQHVLRRC